jgi:hypothetical protein
MARWSRSRLRNIGIGAVAVLGGSLLIIPAVSQAAEEPPRRPAAAQAPASEPDRITMMPGAKGRSAFQFEPGSGDTRAPYAFVSTGGTVRAQQLGGSVTPAAQAKTGAPQRPAQAAAAAAAYKTTLTVDSQNWTAWNKFISLWNRDTWTWVPVTNPQNSLSATASLPPGNYFVAVMYGIYNVDSYLLTKSFTVKSAAQTVKLEEKTAKRVGFTVDDTTAQSDSSTVWISLPNGDLVGFAGGPKTRNYVTTASLPGTTLRVHDVMTKAGSSALRPSPYRYDLVRYWPHPYPASPVKAVKTATLAKTSLTIRGQGTNTDGSYATVPMTGEWTGAYVPTSMRLPASITEYVTPGVNMGRLVDYGAGQSIDLGYRTLSAGTAPGETVGAGPLSPVRRPGDNDSRREGSRMSISENSTLGDAAGHRGGDSSGTHSMTLSSGGTVLKTAVVPSLTVAVPQGEQTYELDHTMTRKVPWSQLSTKIRSEWTFTSQWSPVATDLPLIELGLSAGGLDQRNRAAAGPVPLTIKPSTRESSVPTTVDKVEWSLDDGATWTELPLTTAGDGVVEVTPDMPAGAAFASLRITAGNEQGGALRRTVLRAVAGPATAGDESAGTTTISNVKINGGKALLPGVEGGQIEISSTFTATDPSGIADAGLYLWHGSYNAPDGLLTAYTECTPVNATTANCTALAYMYDVRYSLGINGLAGAWNAEVWASAEDGTGFIDRKKAGTLTIKRSTRVTADATPEPVSKGRTITVTGALTRLDFYSNWTYRAFPAQKVNLQWRKAGATTWTTVKTVTTDASGKLKATAKATADGSYRYSFAGDAASWTSSSSADYVDVK